MLFSITIPLQVFERRLGTGTTRANNGRTSANKQRDAFETEDWSVHRGAHFVLDHAGGEKGMNGIERAKFHQVFMRVLKQSSFFAQKSGMTRFGDRFNFLLDSLDATKCCRRPVSSKIATTHSEARSHFGSTLRRNDTGDTKSCHDHRDKNNFS